jgi:hypothetical protein
VLVSQRCVACNPRKVVKVLRHCSSMLFTGCHSHFATHVMALAPVQSKMSTAKLLHTLHELIPFMTIVQAAVTPQSIAELLA